MYTDSGFTSQNQVASAQLTINIIYSANIIANIWQGDNNSSNPKELTAMGGKLYFSATNSVGDELWVYDPEDIVSNGVNPRMIADINSQGNNSYPTYLTAMGGKLTSPQLIAQWEGTLGL